jgi:hypothetical protein
MTQTPSPPGTGGSPNSTPADGAKVRPLERGQSSVFSWRGERGESATVRARTRLCSRSEILWRAHTHTHGARPPWLGIPPLRRRHGRRSPAPPVTCDAGADVNPPTTAPPFPLSSLPVCAALPHSLPAGGSVRLPAWLVFVAPGRAGARVTCVWSASRRVEDENPSTTLPPPQKNTHTHSPSFSLPHRAGRPVDGEDLELRWVHERALEVGTRQHGRRHRRRRQVGALPLQREMAHGAALFPGARGTCSSVPGDYYARPHTRASVPLGSTPTSLAPSPHAPLR